MSRTIGWVVASVCLAALAAPAARAADEQAVKLAVERGVIFLKGQQGFDGRWPHQQIGATALAALTLIECDVPLDDPAVQKAVEVVRKEAPTVIYTYSLALVILLLDRVGGPGDDALIKTLGNRLLSGQTGDGSWTYNCWGSAPPAGGIKGFGVSGDNSNTQFALLALWAARRHGVNVDAALRRVNDRFRRTQNPDGGWSYISMGQARSFRPPPGMGPGLVPSDMEESTGAMTCAGLLGLAMVHVAGENALRTDPKRKEQGGGRADIKPDSPDLNKDPVVVKGFKALASAMAVSPTKDDPPPGAGQRPPFAPGQPPPGFPGGGPPGFGPPRLNKAGKAYYFLWSLERVAVAYGLETIGNKDWYSWGADVLLANQRPDGSWVGAYSPGGCDTCFALLFLRRANLAKDLSTQLKGRVKDLGAVELRRGGVGAPGAKEDLKPLKPAIDPNEKPDQPAKEKPPAAGGEAKVGDLAAKIIDAPEADRAKLLGEFEKGKGGEYTLALAEAAALMSGDARKQVREALAERLSHLKTANLLDYMKDENLELRRAAAIACAKKDDKTAVPKLIDLLADPEEPVVRAAHAALKYLTKQDFGPVAEASSAEKKKAAEAWRAWWKKQEQK